MHLVAAVGADSLHGMIAAFHDPSGRFHLHGVPGGDVAGLITAIERLGFVGALLLRPHDGAEAVRLSARASLHARALGYADTLAITPAGVVADNHRVEAIESALEARQWDARGAHVTVVGTSDGAEAVVRAASRLGAARIAVIARSRPEAERVLTHAGPGTATHALARGEAAAVATAQRADLLVRCGTDVPLPTEAFGPHLALLDLCLDARRPWQRTALESGTLTIAARDVEAHRMQHALRTLLAEPVVLEPLLALWHGG